MSITVICPGCKKRFTVSDKYAGMTGPCKYCKTPITIPKATEEIVVHGGESFSTGGKDAKGRLILKPLQRTKVRFNQNLAIGIGVGTVVTLIIAFIAGRVVDLDKNWIVASALLCAITPFLVGGIYPLVKKDEMLESITGFELYWRTAAISAAYIGIWASVSFLMDIGVLNNMNLLPWAILIPALVCFGAFMCMCLYELEWGNAMFHVLFYLSITVFLRYLAGIAWFTQVVPGLIFSSGGSHVPPPPVP